MNYSFLFEYFKSAWRGRLAIGAPRTMRLALANEIVRAKTPLDPHPLKMAEKTVFITQPLTKAINILKWKVSEGNTVSIGRVVLLYDFEAAEKKEQRKLKSTHAGTVCRIIAQESAIVQPGYVDVQISAAKRNWREKC